MLFHNLPVTQAPAVDASRMSSFGSFWFGELSPYEAICLSSFIRFGHSVTLFSYEPLKGVPAGVNQADARDIVGLEYLDRFITDGKPNVAHFADYFRYLMLSKTDLSWCDTDVFVLKPFSIDPNVNFFVREGTHDVCSALLRIRRDAPELAKIILKCESMFDRDLPWAVTQGIIRRTFGSRFKDLEPCIHDPTEFMPITFTDFYKVLLPEYADECMVLCKDSKTIHLFNNIFDKIGLYKQLLPPRGSYLHRLFTQFGATTDFIGTYPEPVMRKLIDGWHMRFSAECVGIATIAKQTVPGFMRTMRRLSARKL